MCEARPCGFLTPTRARFSLPGSQMSPHCLLSRSCGSASGPEPRPLCGVRVCACACACGLLFSLKTVVGCRACMTDSPTSSRSLTLAFGALLPVLLLVFALMMLCDRRLCSGRDSQQQTSVCLLTGSGRRVGVPRATHPQRSPWEGCARVDTQSQEAPLGLRGPPTCAASTRGPAPRQRGTP